MQNNPAEWVMPNGNYSSTRYSTLSQINKDNVGDLQPAWTFSTGVLRGHEGGPLVIGDVMYIVTPFPNIVYALDLNDDGRVIWKYEPKQDPSRDPGHVLRHRQPWPVSGYGRRQDRVRARPTLNRWWRSTRDAARPMLAGQERATRRKGVAGQERRSRQGRGETPRPDLQGQGLYRRLRRRVGRAGLPGRLQSQRRQAGLARLLDRSRRPDADRPARRPPISASRSARTAARRPGKASSGRWAAARPGAGTRSIPS